MSNVVLSIDWLSNDAFSPFIALNSVASSTASVVIFGFAFLALVLASWLTPSQAPPLRAALISAWFVALGLGAASA
jgi:hypothetical protein